MGHNPHNKTTWAPCGIYMGHIFKCFKICLYNAIKLDQHLQHRCLFTPNAWANGPFLPITGTLDHFMSCSSQHIIS